MFLAMIMLIAVGCCVREHWNKLGNYEPEAEGLFRRWLLLGVVVPSVFWAVWNLGISERFPAIVPEISIAKANDKVWWHYWTGAVIFGAGLITLSWGAVTYSWMALKIGRGLAFDKEVRQTAAIYGIPMFLLAFIIVYRESWSMLPCGVLIMLLPMVHGSLSVIERPAAVTSYGAAIGKMKFGKYEDAEMKVIEQLEKKENDFEGWMMLAELYATKYHRMDDAAQVILDLCHDPSIQEVEISIACNKLADWQLTLAQNPAAARAALDLLIQRLPGTHFARMAQVRLRQIPRTREDLLDRKKPKPIRLPSLREEGAQIATTSDARARHEATLEANRLSDRLKDDPNDFEARERLAIIVAEKLGQVNLGIEQLRLMVKMPEAMGERAAKWLAQIASWERHLNKNETRFRALLAEIIRDYPNTTQALAAKRQLQLIEYEELEKQRPKVEAPQSVRLRVPGV